MLTVFFINLANPPLPAACKVIETQGKCMPSCCSSKNKCQPRQIPAPSSLAQGTSPTLSPPSPPHKIPAPSSLAQGALPPLSPPSPGPAPSSMAQGTSPPLPPPSCPLKIPVPSSMAQGTSLTLSPPSRPLKKAAPSSLAEGTSPPLPPPSRPLKNPAPSSLAQGTSPPLSQHSHPLKKAAPSSLAQGTSPTLSPPSLPLKKAAPSSLAQCTSHPLNSAHDETQRPLFSTACETPAPPPPSPAHKTPAPSQARKRKYWVPSLCLYDSDRVILESPIEWLNDSIVNGAQTLLKKHALKVNLQGFQDTLLGCGYHFKCLDPTGGSFVQILHVNNNHWVTATDIGCEPGIVKIYDSKYNYMTLDTKKQICSFLKPKQQVLHFHFVSMQAQPDSSSCGLFAVAVATALTYGTVPSLCKWDVNSMRNHLKCSLEKGILEEFPTVGVRRVCPGSIVTKVIKEEIYCVCRMPNDPRQGMIRCSQCQFWYHLSCCEVKQIPAKGSRWKCTKCAENA